MTTSPPAASRSSNERRQFPRFETKDLVVGRLAGDDLPVRVRDVGLGGFSVETVDPLPTGVVHDVEFIAHDDWTTMVRARSLHCRPTIAPDGTPRYSTGFAFEPAGVTRSAIETLIERVTRVRLFPR
jgi:hypothetical protein